MLFSQQQTVHDHMGQCGDKNDNDQPGNVTAAQALFGFQRVGINRHAVVRRDEEADRTRRYKFRDEKKGLRGVCVRPGTGTTCTTRGAHFCHERPMQA